MAARTETLTRQQIFNQLVEGNTILLGFPSQLEAVSFIQSFRVFVSRQRALLADLGDDMIGSLYSEWNKEETEPVVKLSIGPKRTRTFKVLIESPAQAEFPLEEEGEVDG